MSWKVCRGIPGIGFTQTLEPALKDPIYSTALGLLAYGCKCVAQPYTAAATVTAEETQEESPSPERPGFFDRVTDGLNKIAGVMWGSLTDNNDEGGVD